MNSSGETTSFLKAARTFYFIAVFSFTVCLLLNQPVYFRNSYWFLVVTDLLSLVFIYVSWFLYRKKIIGLKPASAVYAYSTLVNLIISNYFFYFYSHHFEGNFLLSTFIYCINLVVAGFCVGRKHAYIAAALYVVSFGPLVYFSGNEFLMQNAVILFFLIVAFSVAVSAFLHLLEKSHTGEMALKETILEKNKALAAENSKKLQLELEIKQKENTAKTMFLLEFAENNSAFIRKLECLKESLKTTEMKTLSNIIQEHRIDNHEKYWKEFETSFLEVHPEFYRKLRIVCSELSPSELKLAALVHLGLSSKQIAGLISNTPESVDVSRSRIRSKLNLSSDTNLKLFLSNL